MPGFGTSFVRRCAGLGGALAVASLTATAGADYAAPEPPPPAEPWYDAFSLRGFVDAYASFNWNVPKPQDRGNSTRAYDTTHGFALSWVGLDAAYDPDPVGGAVSLRLGPTADTYAASCLSAGTAPCDSDVGLTAVKQAYGSWKPDGPEGRITLDFGKFDTLYGAEVAESQDTFNYSRGVVYWYAQPLFHTGFRAAFELSPSVTAKLLAVNGYNNTVDNNVGKTFGLQLALTPSDTFAAYVGWLGGPEQDDAVVLECDPGEAYDVDLGGCAPAAGAPGGSQVVDQGGANELEAWRHLFDLVVAVDPTDDLSLVANADLVLEGVRSPDPRTLGVNVQQRTLWGAMLGARYQLDEVWAAALRGEYLADADGLAGFGPALALATGTLTIEAVPTENLVLRLEHRIDAVLEADAGKKIFPKGERDATESAMTTTLGVVVTTN